MASSSDPTNREAATAIRRKNNGPPFKFLVPLIYAPVLPLIRLTLRKNPVVRDRLFTAVLAGAFAHGFYLISMTVKASEHQLPLRSPSVCSLLTSATSTGSQIEWQSDDKLAEWIQYRIIFDIQSEFQSSQVQQPLEETSPRLSDSPSLQQFRGVIIAVS
ncbi:unnamed protein product [Dovyalis caffra]|uniref:Uncharacterized protein n=1 Tax=Dovyalis caffra TaxID=77055 RepID=A0AAV1SL07_9ROSI|nr:unnamed protein product [Dovyalis caffra]